MEPIDYTFCELREREIINVTDGKRLGKLSDMAFHNGKIVGLIVPGEKKLLKNLSGGDNIYIPFGCVLKIGDDVILVDLHNERASEAIGTPRIGIGAP
ncbi:MAG: YlmC/YmxH family sporulation protein [Clostridia bacterium]|nr:YlmC/YmxH family sporulation protein [Clostridia bacterium]